MGRTVPCRRVLEEVVTRSESEGLENVAQLLKQVVHAVFDAL